MKQILFLLLFPCLALAQYQGNGNQKITLGEQTTADGLVWRGRLADTANLLTNKLDTSVYIVLDTGTRAMWYYRASTTPKWNRVVDSLNNLQGQLSLTSKVTGTLPVENGGTGADMSSLPNNFLIRKNSSGIFDTAALYEANGTIGIGGIANDFSYKVNIFGKLLAKTAGTDNAFTLEATTGTETPNFTFLSTTNRYNMDNASGNFRIFTEDIDGTNGVVRILVMADGKLGIGITPDEKLHVEGNAKISAVGTASASNSALYITNTGVLSTNVSDVNKKHNIRNLPYGLNTINNLNPVAFEWNETDETDIGFIAQDIENVIPESVITNWDSELIFRQEKIIPVLVKAIQEQQALIKALEQRILNLENK